MVEGWGVEPGRGVIAMEARPVPGREVSVGCGCWTWVFSSRLSISGGVISVESGDMGREVGVVDASDDIVWLCLLYCVC